MHSYVITVNGSPHCDDFSIGNCSPRDGTLINTLKGLTEDECQDFCKLTTTCTFYSLRFSTDVCSLYTEDYRQYCQVTGANAVILLIILNGCFRLCEIILKMF